MLGTWLSKAFRMNTFTPLRVGGVGFENNTWFRKSRLVTVDFHLAFTY